MRVISIANLKGGVGKTVTAVNLAHILSTRHAKRVLVIDNDPQGNSSQFFDVYDPAAEGMTEVFLRMQTLKGVICRTKYKSIDVAPANLSLANVETMLDSDRTIPRETRIRSAIDTDDIRGRYDYIIIDNAPSVDMKTINAIVASDYVLIPASVDRFTHEGVRIFTDTIYAIRDGHRLDFELIGTLLTNYNGKDLIYRQAKKLLEFEGYIPFGTEIPTESVLRESTFFKEPIVEWHEYSPAAIAYIDFTKELIARMDAFEEREKQGGGRPCASTSINICIDPMPAQLALNS